MGGWTDGPTDSSVDFGLMLKSPTLSGIGPRSPHS